MSKMNELYEKVAASADLQAEFAEIMEKATVENVAEIQEALLGFAKKQNYDVTLEEIGTFFDGMTTAEKELSDAELDAVAGGKGGSTVRPMTAIRGNGTVCREIISATRSTAGRCNDIFE